MTEPVSTDVFAAALWEQLEAAHDRRRGEGRRRLGVLAAVVAILVVGGGLALLLAPTDPATASPLAIRTLDDGSTQVTLIEPEAPLEQIETQLRAAGLTTDVRLATTGPSQEGRLVSMAFADEIPPALPGDPRVLVPAGSSGPVTLVVGVRAAPGEPYEQPTDAFAEGEPLAAVPTEDRTDAGAVAAAARAAGLVVEASGPDAVVTADAPAGAEVLVAAMRSERVLVLRWG